MNSTQKHPNTPKIDPFNKGFFFFLIRTFYPRSFYYTPGHFQPPNRFANPFSYGGILPQLRELTI